MTKQITHEPIPEFTRADLQVQGSSGYYYPFASKGAAPDLLTEEQQGIFAVHAGLLDGLELTGGDVYVAPGFDLQAAIDSVGAPAVEVAGPTTGGFELANGMQFGRRPIITNRRGSNYERPAERSLTGLDRLVIDALADVRKLPFADESTGVLLASCVPKINQRPVRATAVTKGIEKSYKRALKNVDNPEDRKFTKASQANPRIGLIREASRILKPGGVFIMKGVNPEDLELAGHFGFTPVMCTPPKATKTLKGHKVVAEVFPREVALQKQVTSKPDHG